MKKILFVFISLSAVGLLVLNIGKAEKELDIFKIVSILDHENIMVNDWSIYAREELDRSKVDQEMDEIDRHIPGLEWKISENREMWEAVASVQKKNGIKEIIRILSAKNNNGQSFLIYEVKGKSWNKKTSSFLHGIIFPKINQIFHEKVIIFSCVSSEIDDKMNESVSNNVRGLLKAFQAKEIETLEEDSFVSTSAYSPLFTETIKGSTNNMNLQLGVRKQGLGGKTTLVVGTPIITIEY